MFSWICVNYLMNIEHTQLLRAISVIFINRKKGKLIKEILHVPVLDINISQIILRPLTCISDAIDL